VTTSCWRRASSDDRRDIPAARQLLRAGHVRQDSSFDWHEDRRQTADYVDLRAEMDPADRAVELPASARPEPALRAAAR